MAAKFDAKQDLDVLYFFQSPKLKSRHSEQPVHGQIRAFPPVHAGCLEHDGHIVSLRQIYRL